MLPPPDHTASIGAEFLCLAVLFLLYLISALQAKADGTAVSFSHPRKIMTFTVGFYRVDRYLQLLGDLLIPAAGVTQILNHIFCSGFIDTSLNRFQKAVNDAFVSNKTSL